MTTLLLDKSAFQALNPEELRRSRGRYQVLATDVLLLELLGDLRYCDQRTTSFACKIQTADTLVNMPCHLICGSELLGERVPMELVPVLQGQGVVGAEGAVGVYIPPSKGDLDLLRWSQAEFDEEDLEFVRTWIEAIRNFDLLASFECGVRAVIPRSVRPASIQAVVEFVNASLANPSMNSGFIDAFLAYLPLPAGIVDRIRQRWNRPDPLLSRDAPYSTHCLRVLFVLVISVGSGLVGTRNTNFVDAQYLMYLPFCQLFASGDHVHQLLFPFLALPNQWILLPNELKADLGQCPCPPEGAPIVVFRHKAD
jgi:hypothetical protein